MNITIEQAKTLDAVARAGTIQGAATELNKGHSSIMYSINALEGLVGVPLFDRTGYRNQWTQEGLLLLKHCQNLLSSHRSLTQVCKNLSSGWEPQLKLVYDGVIDFNQIANSIYHLNKSQTLTELQVLAAYLDEVEERFVSKNADFMLTILPVSQPDLFSIKLSPIQLFLVAHKNHPLFTKSTNEISIEELKKETYIKIRKSKKTLGLSTEGIGLESTFSVNDFYTKKQAIQKKLGFGWLPKYLIEKELRNKSLRIITTKLESKALIQPRLYHRSEESLGKTSKQLIRLLKESVKS